MFVVGSRICISFELVYVVMVLMLKCWLIGG